MRWARSAACASTAGFHHGSSRNTWSAAVRLSPVPPALSDISITGGPSSAWKRADHLAAVAASSRPAARRRCPPPCSARLDQVEQRGPLREHQRLVPVGRGRAPAPPAALDLATRCAPAGRAPAPGGRPPAAAAAAPPAPSARRRRSLEQRHHLACAWRRRPRRRRARSRSSSATCSTASVRGGSSGATSRLSRRSTNGRMLPAQLRAGARRRPSAIGRAQRSSKSRAPAEQARGWRSASGSTAPPAGSRPACRVSARRKLGLQREGGARHLAVGVLDGLRLVEHHRVPRRAPDQRARRPGAAARSVVSVTSAAGSSVRPAPW